MKTINLLTAIMVLTLFVSTGYAQNVVVENGRVIIDASGIPHTTVKKPTTTSGTNVLAPNQNATDLASINCNEKVYKKIEVHNNNSNATWRDGIDLCDRLTDGGGGWRLPTQRELILISVLKPELETVTANGFNTNLNGWYWSATAQESSAAFSYYVKLEDGSVWSSSHFRSEVFRVRCIRDI